MKSYSWVLRNSSATFVVDMEARVESNPKRHEARTSKRDMPTLGVEGLPSPNSR